MSVITSSSGYGYNTKRPFVNLLIGDRKPIQLSPDEARSVALQLIEAAETAEQDAFLVEWGTEALGDERTAAALLMQFRKWREEREKVTP
ncbi:MAG TPA: hypothetical protein VIL85_02940 [Thermomicrobiales bacterium]